MPFFKLAKIGFLQSSYGEVSLALMVSTSWEGWNTESTKISHCLPSQANARHAKVSSRVFSKHGICLMWKLANCWDKLVKRFTYLVIYDSFVENSLVVCHATS